MLSVMDGNTWIGLMQPSLLDESLPTPLYHQIYLILRDRIKRGEIAAHSMLPGEQELSRLFGVSRITVKRALKELGVDGLVTRHRGRGTIVAGGVALPVVNASFDNLIESLYVMGLETDLELLEVTTVRAPAEVVHALDLEPGAEVQRVTRRRRLAGTPFSYLRTFVPLDIASLYSESDLATTPMMKLLEQIGCRVHDVEQWISATAAEPVEAAALETDVGAPLLAIERIIRGADGRPLQMLFAHYHPDRYRYHIRTRQRKTAASKTKPALEFA
jgi:GntR family transcriptional regulator